MTGTNDTTGSTTVNAVLDAFFNDELGGVLAGIKDKAKRAWTTRPTVDADGDDVGSAPWRVHKDEGHLEEGRSAFRRGECAGYLIPGSVEIAGGRLATFDVDAEGSADAAIHAFENAGGHVLTFRKPGRPDRAHVWMLLTGEPGNGRLYHGGRHIGDIRGQGENGKQGGVRFYEGEGEALMAAIQAGGLEAAPRGRWEAFATKPREWKAKGSIRSVKDAYARVARAVGGDRYYTMRDAVASLVVFGLWDDSALAQVQKAYRLAAGMDYPGEHLDKLVVNAARGAQAKVDSGEWEMRKAGSRKRKLDIDGAVEALGGDTLTDRLAEHGIRVRHNVRAMADEYSRNGTAWRPITDREEANARLLVGGLDWEDRVWKTLWLNTLYHHECDPFLDYLERLPEWDGTPRVDDWCMEAFLVKDRPFDRQVARWTGIHIFLGCVTRTLHPGTKLDVTPILHGPQGSGKSWHLDVLFPETVRGAFGDDLALAGDSKKMLEAIQGKALVEIAEMQGLSRTKLDGLKAFMTRRVDSGIRLAYRKNPEHAPRRCVFVGTVNDDGTGILPEDGTGNRRWAAVEIEARGRHPNTFGPERDQYWAEAMHRVKAGEDPTFPVHLEADQAVANEALRQIDPFEDIVETMVEGARAWLETRPSVGAIPMSALYDMAGMLGDTDEDGGSEGQKRTAAQVPKADSMRLCRALKARGWTKVDKVQVKGQRERGFRPPR